MKGGTAINLFLRDMPRLSVDIDVVYILRHRYRDLALQEIASETKTLAKFANLIAKKQTSWGGAFNLLGNPPIFHGAQK